MFISKYELILWTSRRVSMDSRLRGNDTDVPCDPDVIPAKAGIHLRVIKKSERIIHNYLDNFDRRRKQALRPLIF